MTKHKADAPFKERTGSHLNEAAATSLMKGTSRKGEVDYEVACPTCLGTVRATEFVDGTYRTIDVDGPHVGILNQQAPEPVAQRIPVVAMRCGCGMVHPNAPSGVTGCGSLWVVPA